MEGGHLSTWGQTGGDVGRDPNETFVFHCLIYPVPILFNHDQELRVLLVLNKATDSTSNTTENEEGTYAKKTIALFLLLQSRINY